MSDESKPAGQTGIEIRTTNTGTAVAVFKAFHAMHLDFVNELMTKSTVAVITVDGTEVMQPLAMSHFVPCEPGEHTVKMFFHRGGLDAMQRLYNEASTPVTVEAGKVTQLEYMLRSLTRLHAELHVVGTRPV